MSALRFDTKKAQPFRDMGGDSVAVYAGECSFCGRKVYGIQGKDGYAIDPDPRGMIPPRHALSSMVASEYDASGPDVAFCWDCATG